MILSESWKCAQLKCAQMVNYARTSRSLKSFVSKYKIRSICNSFSLSIQREFKRTESYSCAFPWGCFFFSLVLPNVFTHQSFIAWNPPREHYTVSTTAAAANITYKYISKTGRGWLNEKNGLCTFSRLRCVNTINALELRVAMAYCNTHANAMHALQSVCRTHIISQYIAY